MRFYQLDTDPGVQMSYHSDLKGVKAATRNLLGFQRENARVRLVDIPTHKAALVRVLNGVPDPYTTLRQWRISPRHRYIEIPADEE